MYNHPAKKRNIRANALPHLAISCMVLVSLFAPTCLHAKDYSFSWTANPEPVEGYKLYYKKGGEPAPPFDGSDSPDGPSPIDVGKQTTFTITGLDETATYHFALKAYNGTDESDYTDVLTANGALAGAAPPPTGSKAFTFTLEESNNTDIASYRINLNDELLCESTNAAETTITCYADLHNETMSFTAASVDSSGTEISRSNALVLNPADIPQLYTKRAATFTWEYDSANSSALGYRIYQNDKVICETADPGVRQLICEMTLEPTNFFKVAAVDNSGAEISVSNLLTYAAETTATETEALTAVITASTQEGVAPLTVTFDATASTGAVDNYSWTFGDGDSATGSTAAHTYGSPGTFTANLTIADASNTTAQANVAITVNGPGTSPVGSQAPPTAVISSSTAVGNAPLTVQFDGTASSANQSPITSYTWKFGDGSTSQGATSTHTYSIPGTYQASLTVTDNVGLTGQTSTPVIVNTPPSTTNQPPVSLFTVSPDSGTVPLTVSFDGSAANDPDGTISEYLWIFGDGTSATGSSPQHTFQVTGDYTVTLKVIDNNGSAAVSSQTIQALVQGEMPFNFELLEANLDQNWVRLTFKQKYKNPVVVAGPPSFNDAEPVTVRLKNIDATGFDARLQEWEYQDGTHAPEKVSFIVMEQGNFTLEDGTDVESGTFSGSSTFKQVSLKQSYNTSPVILTQVGSENESDAVTGRLRNINSIAFEYRMQEQEANKDDHASETIGYIAWEPGKGEISDLLYESGFTAQQTDNWSDITLQTALPNTPLFFATMQTHADLDTVALRSRSLSTTAYQLKIDEEQSLDGETIHLAEIIGYLAIGTSTQTNQPPEASASSEKQFTFTWEYNGTQPVNGFKLYINNNLLCKTSNPNDRQLTCFTPLLNQTMNFTMTTISPDGSESEPSSVLRISPDASPELFGIRLVTFVWEFNENSENTIGGFKIFHNNIQVCETHDPTLRQLTCKLQLDTYKNSFTIKTINLDMSESNDSNQLYYSQ